MIIPSLRFPCCSSLSITPLPSALTSIALWTERRKQLLPLRLQLPQHIFDQPRWIQSQAISCLKAFPLRWHLRRPSDVSCGETIRTYAFFYTVVNSTSTVTPLARNTLSRTTGGAAGTAFFSFFIVLYKKKTLLAL